MDKLDLEVILNVLIWKGKNIMKKKILITMLTVSLLMPVMTGCGADNRNSDEVQKETVKDVSEMVHMENAAAVKELMDAAYAKVAQDMLPAALDTNEMDTADMDAVTYNTGLNDLTGIDNIILSESMMNAVAYSAVYLITNDEADSSATRDKLMDSVDPAKWICTSAEKQAAVLIGKDVFFVMGRSDTVDAVMSAVIEEAKSRNFSVSETVERVNEI